MGLFDFLKNKTMKQNEPQAVVCPKNITQAIPESNNESDTSEPLRANVNNPIPVNKEEDVSEIKTVTFKVTGIEHYKDALLNLAGINEDYSLNKKSLIEEYPFGGKIYEYDFYDYKVEFEYEPTNEYDPNAIKVLLDGSHVGYIKKGNCSRLKNLIKSGKINKTTAKVGGGRLKDLYYDDYEESYDLSREERPFFITLTIELKEK